MVSANVWINVVKKRLSWRSNTRHYPSARNISWGGTSFSWNITVVLWETLELHCFGSKCLLFFHSICLFQLCGQIYFLKLILHPTTYITELFPSILVITCGQNWLLGLRTIICRRCIHLWKRKLFSAVDTEYCAAQDRHSHIILMVQIKCWVYIQYLDNIW